MAFFRDDSAAVAPVAPADKVIEGSVYFLLFFSPLAVGTVDAWSFGVVMAVSLLAFAALAYKRRIHGQLAVTPLGVVLLGVALFTGLQALPMPSSWVALLSPTGHALQQMPFTGAGVDGRWLSLSLDRYATLMEFAKLLGLTLLFLVIVNHYGHDAARVRRLLSAVTYAGALVAAIGFLQKFFGANRLWGIFDVGTFFVSTFVNPNHLAGFLGISSPVALGLSLTSRDTGKRVAFAGLSIFIAVAVFLSLSRGGIIAFVAGQVFLACMLWMGRVRNRRRAFWVPIFATLVLCTAGWLAYAKIAAEFKNFSSVHAVGEEARLQIWQDDLPMAWDFAATGIGRGAYGQVHTRYKTSADQITFTHAENAYLQALVDWGFCGLLMIFCIAGTVWLSVRQGPGRGKWAGISAALFVVALHNFVDFNINTGAVAILFVSLLGLSTARACESDAAPRWLPKIRLSVAGARWAAPVCLALMTTAFVMAQQYSLEADTQRLAAAQQQPGKDFLTAAQQAAMRHPADYFVALTTGNALLTQDHRDVEAALDWLSRAVHLNPTEPSGHLLTARALLSMGAVDEAIVAYRLAGTFGSRERVLNEIGERVPGFSAWQDAVPPDVESQIQLARYLLAKGKGVEARALIDSLVVAMPDNLKVLPLAADLAERDGDPIRAANFARHALADDEHQVWAYLVLSRTVALTDGTDATQILEQGLRHNASPELVEALAQRAFARHDYEAARPMGQRLMAIGAMAQGYFVLGQIEEAEGRLPLALQQYRAAQSSSPSNLTYQFAAARILERIGIKSEAVAAYRAILQRDPSSEWVRSRLRDLEEEGKMSHVQ